MGEDGEKKNRYLLLICEAFTIEMSWNSGHQSCPLTSHCLSQTDKAQARWHWDVTTGGGGRRKGGSKTVLQEGGSKAPRTLPQPV